MAGVHRSADRVAAQASVGVGTVAVAVMDVGVLDTRRGQFKPAGFSMPRLGQSRPFGRMDELEYSEPFADSGAVCPEGYLPPAQSVSA